MKISSQPSRFFKPETVLYFVVVSMLVCFMVTFHMFCFQALLKVHGFAQTTGNVNFVECCTIHCHVELEITMFV